MVSDKLVSESECPGAIVVEKELTNEAKVVVRKVVGKKRQIGSKKIRTISVQKHKVMNKDSLPNASSKKIKRNGHSTPLPTSHDDFNNCSSVPSVASTEDSDLPDSVMSPTDEETCSYVTEEEFYCAGDSVSIESGSEKSPVVETGVTESPLQPALRFSSFPHVPPCLNFCLHDEKAMELPWPIRRHLKWKLSTITPAVVRKTVVNSGVRIIKEPKDWIGTWGKHMKSVLFRLVLAHQKVNHFPGTFQIGRKDRLWRNLQNMVTKYGNDQFGFLPQTYILPHDLRLLRQVWSRNTTDIPWIIKPPASARGTGIQVIHQWSQLPRKRPLVVQSYVKNPYLINNTKFDIRLYVFVTSVDPLRIYLYEDGLVRFASMSYSSDMKTLSDSYVHLTNYSINKNSEGYVANEDANLCQGHKWTLKSLWFYLEERGVDVEGIKSSVSDIVVKTLLSAENILLDMAKGNVSNRYQCYELFGFDVLLDENLKPWLLEVNISPSLHSTSSLDLSVKGPLIRDVFNMARFHVPNNMSSASKKILSDYISEHFPDRVMMQRNSDSEEGSQYCLDLDSKTLQLTEDERKKHELYETGPGAVHSNGGVWIVEKKAECTDDPPADVLDDLNQDDLRQLVETEDEMSQARGFTRVFPSAGSDRYFSFMDRVRYYNVLLDAWQKKFGKDRQSAIAFIKEKCMNKEG